MSKEPLGQVLVKHRIITPQQLEMALATQKKRGGSIPLGRVLASMGFCTSGQIARALAFQSGSAHVDFAQQELDLSLREALPRSAAESLQVVPFRREGKALAVAMRAPITFKTCEEVRRLTKAARVVPYLAADDAIVAAIQKLYGATATETEMPTLELTAEEVVPETVPVPRTILLFGWNDVAAQTISQLCATQGLQTRRANSADVARCEQADILVSPLNCLEAVVARGQQPAGQWIVMGKEPGRDVPKAKALGARAFLPNPIVGTLLLRALFRVQGLAIPAA
jgi:hypothetical protein